MPDTPMPTIPTGYVRVDAPCPECGSIAEIVARIGTTLTTPDDDVPTLRLRLKAKAVPHECRVGRGQLTIDSVLRDGAGLVLSDPGDDES